MNLEITFIISQILVILAMILDYLSFQQKKRKKMLLILGFSAMLIAFHYLLLNQINAFILIIISTLSFFVSAYTTNPKILSIFFALYLIPIILNFTQIVDTLLFIALYIILLAKFLSNDKFIRILIMNGTSLVIIYNIMIFSPMGIVLELVFLISNFSGYYKYYIKKI